MKKYIIMLVAALASLCASAGEPFYKNIYADFTMGFSRDYDIWVGSSRSTTKRFNSNLHFMATFKTTQQFSLGAGYRITPRWNAGFRVTFDNGHYLYVNNINAITTFYGEYAYLKWKRLSLSAVPMASIITFDWSQNERNLGEIGFGLGADFKIIRQVQLIVRYGFFGLGIGNRNDYYLHYWNEEIHPGCYSNDRSGLTADFGIRRLQFGIRVNL
ncbi:MAG: hypothetical protein K2I18_10495 [Paramuribaculum sp.]|nr:hypothetical protein [Paramuribaculum sp.]